ncbi:hypothetical protein ACFSTC_07060 [Nonomuraea ferruginea]
MFSFGATLAYAATGRHPYGTGPASAVAYRVVHHEPDLEGAPGWLEPLLAECLATDPAARPVAADICARLGVAAVPRLRRLPRPSVGTGRRSGRDVHHMATREWQPGRAVGELGGGRQGAAPGEGAQALAGSARRCSWAYCRPRPPSRCRRWRCS